MKERGGREEGEVAGGARKGEIEGRVEVGGRGERGGRGQGVADRVMEAV